jgi:hypothetical protein
VTTKSEPNDVDVFLVMADSIDIRRGVVEIDLRAS